MGKKAKEIQRAVESGLRAELRAVKQRLRDVEKSRDRYKAKCRGGHVAAPEKKSPAPLPSNG